MKNEVNSIGFSKSKQFITGEGMVISGCAVAIAGALFALYGIQKLKNAYAFFSSDDKHFKKDINNLLYRLDEAFNGQAKTTP